MYIIPQKIILPIKVTKTDSSGDDDGQQRETKCQKEFKFTIQFDLTFYVIANMLDGIWSLLKIKESVLVQKKSTEIYQFTLVMSLSGFFKYTHQLNINEHKFPATNR